MIRFFISRLCMKNTLVRCCKKAGASISFKNRFSVFSRIDGKGNDFYIETEAHIYSVKLIGFVFTRKSLCFVDETHYSVKEYGIKIFPNAAFDDPYITKEKSKCDFEAYIPAATKTVERIYLLCPDPWIKASIIEGNGMREIASGDTCGDACFYTLIDFMKKISNVA